MKASWFFVILLLVVVAVFSVQNAEPISVHFLAWQYSASAALVIQLAALLGALVGLTVGSVSARAARRRREQAEAERARQAREAAEAERAHEGHGAAGGGPLDPDPAVIAAPKPRVVPPERMP